MNADEPAITLRVTRTVGGATAYLSAAGVRHLGDPDTLAIRPNAGGTEVAIVADGGELMATDNSAGARFSGARLTRLGFPLRKRVTGRADGPGRVAFPLGGGIE